MARTNTQNARLKPEATELLVLHVLRRRRISPHFARVTLGRGDADRFRPMGFDQWFRLFLPVADNSLSRLPSKLDTLHYLKYLAIPKSSRPVLRNYTVRAHRADGPDGPEIDVDFVLHGSAADGTAGPAASWAESCREGDAVALLDEGIMFNAGPDVTDVLLVADETGLPAVAGVLAGLPGHMRGAAVIEIPSDDDRQEIEAPEGVAVHWVTRVGDGVPGEAARAFAEGLPVGGYGWAVGEQALPAAMRRHWIAGGLPKDKIMFCGYWKSTRGGRKH